MGDPEPVQQRREAATVLGEIDRVDRRPEQRHPILLEGPGEAQWRLAAELDDHALGPLDVDHGEDVLGRERLEVKAVGGVVVGRDCLRVAVDHHRVAPRLAHGHRRVNAAVVELDPLTDPVRPRAEDHDRRAISPPHLTGGAIMAAALVGRVVIRRAGLELGRAGVDRAVGAGQLGGSVTLVRQQLELAQEPGVDRGPLAHLLDPGAAPERLEQEVVAVG